jgi:glycosyltransferase involved in cell wall biosynthesis
MLDGILRILMLHNYYQYPGGEDVSMAIELKALHQAQHIVNVLTWNNSEIERLTWTRKATLPLQAIWNNQAKIKVKEALEALSADLLHVQNFFPLASPAVHIAAKEFAIPTIQHLRNFRLGCLNAYLYRENQVCEICVGHNPWRGILYRCYRNSLAPSLGVWGMITTHRFRKTWFKDVDAFIVPSFFAASKLIEIGMPEDSLYVKPNCFEDPFKSSIDALQTTPQTELGKKSFTYIGRLSDEKGVLNLLVAWEALRDLPVILNIVGDGPQRASLQLYTKEKGLKNIVFRGHCSSNELVFFLQESLGILVPSKWYETFGRVVVEAFACGRPAIVSDLGALAELVEEGKTGFKVPSSEPQAWADCIRWCVDHPIRLQEMGRNARQCYLDNYTPAINCQQLTAIYRRVLKG